MKMKKFAALAAATVMSVSAIAATSAFGVFATTDAGVNNIVICLLYTSPSPRD